MPFPPGSHMPDLEYSTVVLGSYTAVQHGSYCIIILAVRILLYSTTVRRGSTAKVAPLTLYMSSSHLGRPLVKK